MPRPALAAARRPDDSKRGLALAKTGDCVKALPILEGIDARKRRPSVSIVIGDCKVVLGDLVGASEVYHAVGAIKPNRKTPAADRTAIAKARQKAAEVDERFPLVSFEVGDNYEDLEITLDGRAVSDPSTPQRVPPYVKVRVVARAKGFQTFSKDVTLNERDRLIVPVHLKPGSSKAPSTQGAEEEEVAEETPKEEQPEAKALQEPKAAAKGPSKPTPVWIGPMLRTYILPRAFMNLVADGGRTVAIPGIGIGITQTKRDYDLLLSFGWAGYFMGETPFKPKGAPDTDWEIADANLHALYATAELLWRVPLDDKKTWTFRFGGGVGLGWMVGGALHRTQSYPLTLEPGDPYTYRKCGGPNNPAGSYRYCNTLDWDASHYNGYAEADWFHHGKRPSLYPWVALPELGFSYRYSETTYVDFEFSLTISGILAGLAARYSL